MGVPCWLHSSTDTNRFRSDAPPPCWGHGTKETGGNTQKVVLVAARPQLNRFVRECESTQGLESEKCDQAFRGLVEQNWPCAHKVTAPSIPHHQHPAKRQVAY